MDNKLKELISLCKVNLMIQINEHKVIYMDIPEYLNDLTIESCHVDQSILDECINRDTLIEIYAHPKTPIGFYWLIHYDIDTAIDEMIRLIKDNQ